MAQQNELAFKELLARQWLVSGVEEIIFGMFLQLG